MISTIKIMKKNLLADGLPFRNFTKAALIMKLTFLLLLTATLHVSGNVIGQAKVSLQLNQVKITQAIDAIERQGNYRFLYNSELKGMDRKVNVALENADIKDALTGIFNGTGLTFKMLENNLIVIVSATAAAQDIQVTGKVTGENGEALPGVSVSQKGSSRGTTTNSQGEFTISVLDNATIVISYIGYTDQEIAVNSRTRIDVKLAQSNRAL